MKELGLDIDVVRRWFKLERDTPYVLVRVAENDSSNWKTHLATAIRRCYIADEDLKRRAEELKGELGGTAENRQKTIIAAKVPEKTQTRAGDAGEMIVFLYNAVAAHPNTTIGPKKWRLKQEKDKPAPCSDIVQFVLPTWPKPSDKDEILCAEVKLKSKKKDDYDPIARAIEGCAKDRTSRLSRTLRWLKERAIADGLGETKIAHIDRFIQSPQHGSYKKTFRAVAILSEDLLKEEIKRTPAKAEKAYSLVIIAIPELYNLYNALLEAAKTQTVAGGGWQ